MRRFIVCVIVVVVTVVLTRPVVSRQARYKGNALDYDLKLYNQPKLLKGGQGKPEMPDILHANLVIDRMGSIPLKLNRKRFMGIPNRIFASSEGKALNSKQYNNKENVFFYIDEETKASFACDLTINGKTGEPECKMSLLFSYGNHSCYIGGGAEKADCTEKVIAKRDVMMPRDRPGGDRPDPAIQPIPYTDYPGDYVLPEKGHKTVEFLMVVDAKFMTSFYDRYPDDSDKAQEEATLYLTLYANEMNVFYDSFDERTSGKFSIYLYPIGVVMPEPRKDFPWSKKYNDGTILYADDEMDLKLWRFVERLLDDYPDVDHVMTLTGFDLYLDGDDLLGYAYSNTVCSTVTYKYSLVEFTEADPAGTGAHEIAHALGAPHDEDAGCDPSYYLMTNYPYYPDETTRDQYFRFSKCSLRAIKAHLRSEPKCTEQNSFTDEQFKELFCAGFLGSREDSLNEQCRVVTGNIASVACDNVTEDSGCYLYDSVRCTDESGKCKRILDFVWSGTPCGAEKMCFRGHCTDTFEICPSEPVVPCTCCGYDNKADRKTCCKTGRKMHDKADCYCCGDLRREEPPEGWVGPRY